MRFKEGEIVRLRPSDPDRNGKWVGFRARVLESTTVTTEYVHVVPLSPRPDGYGLTPFRWEIGHMTADTD